MQQHHIPHHVLHKANPADSPGAGPHAVRARLVSLVRPLDPARRRQLQARDRRRQLYQVEVPGRPAPGQVGAGRGAAGVQGGGERRRAGRGRHPARPGRSRSVRLASRLPQFTAAGQHGGAGGGGCGARDRAGHAAARRRPKSAFEGGLKVRPGAGAPSPSGRELFLGGPATCPYMM